LRDWTVLDLHAMARGPRPKAALAAYLALSGFYITELLELHKWSEAERSEILESIRTVYTSLPEDK
jgi:hypothetical protein